jgi:hypothetical protein
MKDFAEVFFSVMVDEHLSVGMLLVVVRKSFCKGETMNLAWYGVDEEDRLLFLSGDVGGHMLVVQTLLKGYYDETRRRW